MGLSKHACEVRHARRRARQRFGVRLTKGELRGVVEAIRDGRALFLDRQSCRVTRWLYPLSGELSVAVYDSKQGTIVTFLPLAYVGESDALREAWRAHEERSSARTQREAAARGPVDVRALLPDLFPSS